MHDFSCTSADDMLLPIMQETMCYYIESPEGVESMCRVMEEMRNEALAEWRQQERISNIGRPMESMKNSADDAMHALQSPPEER